MKNIVLIGMPGCGKTAIGTLLAAHLKKQFLDFDEFIIEKTGKDAADHLADLGDDNFLDLETELAKKIDIEDAVIASSGSVPLREEGINHLRKNAVTVWIDAPLDLIKKRVKKRFESDTRVVGAQSMSFDEIWDWRKNAYESNHDLYLRINEDLSKDEVMEEVLKLLSREHIHLRR